MGRAWIWRAGAWGLLARLPASGAWINDRVCEDDKQARCVIRTQDHGRPHGREPSYAGRPVQAIVRVRLVPSASRPDFERYLRTIPAVLSACQLAGDVDYELRLGCQDIADLDVVLTALRRCGGAEGTSTGLVLREVPGLGELEFSGPPGPGTAPWRKP
jgi:Lrp/AsnC ligand binding domain